MKDMKKKGNVAIGLIISLVLGLVVLSIYLAVGFSVTEKLQSTQTTDGTAYNATGTILTSLDDVPAWIPVIVVVVVAVGIIALLKMFKVF